MANRIPPEIIDTIMQRADIIEIVGEYVPLKRRGRNWFGLCPFHNEDTPSFSVNQEKQIYKCFGCGKGGNVIGFVQEIEHMSFGEAAHRLADRYGITIPEKALTPEEQHLQAERQAMLTAHAVAAEFYAALLSTSAVAQAYMKKRGIESAFAERFFLGMAPENDWQALYTKLHAEGYGDELLIKAGLISKSAKNGRCYDKFHGRLIFPIRDHRGAVIAFGGRAIGDEQPKYLNSQTTPIYNKSHCLYALDLAAASIREQKQVVVMEGYMDVLTAHQTGVTNAVASLGTAFTNEHARLLRRFAPDDGERLQVLLSFDGDSAGEKAARLSLDKLNGFDFIDARVLIYPESLDPDDFLRQYGRKGWQRLKEKYCYPLLDYLLLKALEKFDTSNAAGKGALVTELIPAMQKSKNRTELDSFIRELSRRLNVSEDAIRSDLNHGSGQQTVSSTLTRPGYKEKRFRPGRPANRQLLLLSLSDKNIFSKACMDLGELFGSTEEEDQLISYISSLGENYDFQPSSLFNDLDEEKEGLRQFLLKLLQTEPAAGETDRLVEDYILTIKRHELTEKIGQMQRRISEAEEKNEDSSALVQEKMQLMRAMKQL